MIYTNKVVIVIASNLVFHKHTKHVEVNRHLVKEAILYGWIFTPYTRNEDQVTNIITKYPAKKLLVMINKPAMIYIHALASGSVSYLFLVFLSPKFFFLLGFIPYCLCLKFHSFSNR